MAFDLTPKTTALSVGPAGRPGVRPCDLSRFFFYPLIVQAGTPVVSAVALLRLEFQSVVGLRLLWGPLWDHCEKKPECVTTSRKM